LERTNYWKARRTETVKVRELVGVEEEKRVQARRNSCGKELKELMVKGERKRRESR
jgi:hypothetical protein